MAVSDLQQRLAKDPRFLARVENLLVNQAHTVKADTLAPVTHKAYADAVLVSSPSKASHWAVALSSSPNVVAAAAANGGDGGEVTDAALLSQIATYWPVYAVAG